MLFSLVFLNSCFYLSVPSLLIARFRFPSSSLLPFAEPLCLWVQAPSESANASRARAVQMISLSLPSLGCFFLLAVLVPYILGDLEATNLNFCTPVPRDYHHLPLSCCFLLGSQPLCLSHVIWQTSRCSEGKGRWKWGLFQTSPFSLPSPSRLLLFPHPNACKQLFFHITQIF